MAVLPPQRKAVSGKARAAEGSRRHCFCSSRGWFPEMAVREQNGSGLIEYKGTVASGFDKLDETEVHGSTARQRLPRG
jgi:hypothetical protein